MWKSLATKQKVAVSEYTFIQWAINEQQCLHFWSITLSSDEIKFRNIILYNSARKAYAWSVISFVATVGGNLTITGSAGNCFPVILMKIFS